MNDFKINLSFENRLHLNKKAGTLTHVFGEGYFITDEYGREVNTLVQEKEFDRLISLASNLIPLNFLLTPSALIFLNFSLYCVFNLS